MVFLSNYDIESINDTLRVLFSSSLHKSAHFMTSEDLISMFWLLHRMLTIFDSTVNFKARN